MVFFVVSWKGKKEVLPPPWEVEPPFWEVEPPPWKVVNYDKKIIKLELHFGFCDVPGVSLFSEYFHFFHRFQDQWSEEGGSKITRRSPKALQNIKESKQKQWVSMGFYMVFLFQGSLMAHIKRWKGPLGSLRGVYETYRAHRWGFKTNNFWIEYLKHIDRILWIIWQMKTL